MQLLMIEFTRAVLVPTSQQAAQHFLSSLSSRPIFPLPPIKTRPNPTPMTSRTNTSSRRRRRSLRLALNLQPHLHPPRQIPSRFQLGISEEAPRGEGNQNDGQNEDDCYDEIGIHDCGEVVWVFCILYGWVSGVVGKIGWGKG